MEDRTIGEEFASQWLTKHGLSREHKGKEEEFAREVARAIDSFVKSKPEELKPVIRDVAMRALDGDTEAFRETDIEGQPYSVSARQLLKHRELVFVGNKYQVRGVQIVDIHDFPV